MSNEQYWELWHYSEQFTRDRLQRSELVTIAWKEGVKLGKRSSAGLMRSIMHFRARELNRRSAFPAQEMGKSIKDAWNHKRIALDQPMNDCDGQRTLGDLLIGSRTTALDILITNEFLDALSNDERTVMDDLVAGYKMNEIAKRHRYPISHVHALRTALREKSAAYL